jgi:hypothetical protein
MLRLLFYAIVLLFCHETRDIQGCKEVYVQEVRVERFIQVLSKDVLWVQFDKSLD